MQPARRRQRGSCWQMLVEAEPRLRVLSEHAHVRRCMPAVQCLMSRQYLWNHCRSDDAADVRYFVKNLVIILGWMVCSTSSLQVVTQCLSTLLPGAHIEYRALDQV